jgi:hypothetical protein
MSVLEFRKQVIEMAEDKGRMTLDDIPDEKFEEVQRSLNMPIFLWERTKEEAQRNRRSVNRFIEALLMQYFEIDPGMEIDLERLNRAKYLLARQTEVEKLKKTGTK